MAGDLAGSGYQRGLSNTRSTLGSRGPEKGTRDAAFFAQAGRSPRKEENQTRCRTTGRPGRPTRQRYTVIRELGNPGNTLTLRR